MKLNLHTEPLLVQANRFTPQTITCSFTDQLLKNLPVPVCFFYKNSVEHPALIEALKVVLNDFPIFAGILTSIAGQLYIECNNQGVLFSVAKDESSINQLIAELPKTDKHKLINQLDGKKVIAQQSPVLTFKITYFACGGMAIGACWHHSIGDMHSFMQLMKAWANTFNAKEYAPPLLVNDRQTYLQAHLTPNQNITPGVRYLRISELLKLIAYRPFATRSKTILRFYFSESELQAMKQAFLAATGESVSKNNALCAHLFSLISKLDTGNNDRTLSIAVNYRAKEKLPPTIFGNFISSINLSIQRQTVEPFQLAKQLNAAVNQFSTLHMDFFSTQDFIAQKIGNNAKTNRLISTFVNPLKKTLLVTNWSGFGVYEVVFGQAQPFFFSSFSNYPFSWLSSITKGFANQGLIYSVHLPTALARKLMQAEVLHQVHKYRDKETIVPEEIATLKWLL